MKKHPAKYFCILFFFLLLLVGSNLFTYFRTRSAFSPAVPSVITPTAAQSTPAITADKPTATPATAPPPTTIPTVTPTMAPTIPPAMTPTVVPSMPPAMTPTVVPSMLPAMTPTVVPSMPPTMTPAMTPTPTPTAVPTPAPTKAPVTVPAITPADLPTPTPVITPASLPTNVPTTLPGNTDSNRVSANGQLQVIGTDLCNADGNAIVLHGISTAGIAWFPKLATAEYMKTLRDEWGTDVFRIAMYSYEGDNSYLRNPSWNLTRVCSLIDAAISLDEYVIVDWHILADGNPQSHQNDAIAFFTEIASRYPNCPNLLYEICNEPNGNVSWSGNIKPYAEKVIPVIRKHSPNAVILVGTPTWSQDVDAAANDPLNYDNIMYSLHFYAGTHKDWLRDKAKKALAKGIALFVSEWGTTDASGNGAVDKASSLVWLDFLDEYGISWCNWSLCNKAESSALLLPSAEINGTLPDSALTESGKFVKEQLRKRKKAFGAETIPSITATPTATPAPSLTSPPTDLPISSGKYSLEVMSYNTNREKLTGTISPCIRLCNDSNADIALKDLVLRYYYTPENNLTQCFWCDYADVRALNDYRSVTPFVQGNYQTTSSCMEITFTEEAGTLPAGAVVSLQLRIANEDWSNFDQTNDLSFLADAADFTVTEKIGIEIKNTKIRN